MKLRLYGRKVDEGEVCERCLWAKVTLARVPKDVLCGHFILHLVLFSDRSLILAHSYRQEMMVPADSTLSSGFGVEMDRPSGPFRLYCYAAVGVFLAASI
jgi:hypothetical protein